MNLWSAYCLAIWFVGVVTQTCKPLALCLCVTIIFPRLCFLFLSLLILSLFKCTSWSNSFTYRLFTVCATTQKLFLRNFSLIVRFKVNQKKSLPRSRWRQLIEQRQRQQLITSLMCKQDTLQHTIFNDFAQFSGKKIDVSEMWLVCQQDTDSCISKLRYN